MSPASRKLQIVSFDDLIGGKLHALPIASKRRIWRKIHIEIDEKTLEIRAAEFPSSDVGDAPMLPGLFAPGQEIASVTADGAFDTRKCHDAIAARSAAAIIPPRKNAKPWKADTAGAASRPRCSVSSGWANA
jgi:hypothetical protein